MGSIARLNRPLRPPRLRFFSLILCSSLSVFASQLTSCSFPTDADPLPASKDPALTFLGLSLSNPIESLQPVNPVITLSFSDILDPDTGALVAIRLGGRGSPIETLVEHNQVERKLTLRPKASLQPESEYQIDIGTSLKSLAGVSLDRTTRLTFRTGKDVLPNPAPETPLTLADIIGAKGQLKTFCATSGCHAVQAAGEVAARNLDLSMATPALRSFLVGTSASGSPESLRLVQPGQPEKSYLLRKILATGSFTRIIGDPMPAEDSPPLGIDATLAVQRWIRQGAN
ncbi:MAG: Ig-like domain-containing protein [Myxococcales bacterium]|nr:Ig-like domain-containing protein [Myxococcales bacterium]